MTADDLRELAATALAYIAARDAEPEPYVLTRAEKHEMAVEYDRARGYNHGPSSCIVCHHGGAS